MDARPAVRSRVFLLLFLVGAVPALLAYGKGGGILQPLDLPLAAAVLPLGFLLAWLLPQPGLSSGSALGLALVLYCGLTPLARSRLQAPITNDEQAYLFQADLYASGRLAEPLVGPSCPPGRALCPLHRRQVYEDPVRGVRYPKYPPGTALALVPGTAMGAPGVMVFLAGLLDLALILRLARRHGLRRPEWAPLLLAASPFFLLVQTSFQSEVFTLPAVLGGALVLLRIRERSLGPWWGGMLFGVLVGWVFLVRPLTGVVYAAAAVPGLLGIGGSDGGRGHGARWAPVLGAVLGGLPFLALLLGYQWLQTGSPWTSPYALYAARFGPFGPGGEVLDVYGRGPFMLGLLRQFGRWSVAFFGMLGAVALGFAGLARGWRRDGGSFLLFALLLPIAYSFHWYAGHRGYLGPLYLYESLGPLILGALSLLQDGPARWRRGILLATVIGGLVIFLTRFPLDEELARQRAAPQRAAAALPPGSVLLLPWSPDPRERERSLKLYTPSRPPFLPGQTVIIRALPTPSATHRALQSLHLSARPLTPYAG